MLYLRRKGCLAAALLTMAQQTQNEDSDLPALHVLLLWRRKRDSNSEVLPLKALTPEQRARWESFGSEKRREEYLWSRLLLRSLLQRLPIPRTAKERAPQPPLAVAPEQPDWFCSISHTSTWIAAAVSSLPCALDVEWMRPNRDVPPLFTRVFGEAAWEATPAAERVTTFYRWWGAKECAVKMDAEFALKNCEPVITCQRTTAVLYSQLLAQDTMLVCAAARPFTLHRGETTEEELLRELIPSEMAG